MAEQYRKSSCERREVEDEGAAGVALKPSERVLANVEALQLWEEIEARELARKLTVTGYEVAGKPASFSARVEERHGRGFRTVTQVTKEGALAPNAPSTTGYSTLPVYLLAPRAGESSVFLRFHADSVTLTDPRGRASHRVAVPSAADRSLLEDLEQLCRCKSGELNLFDLALLPTVEQEQTQEVAQELEGVKCVAPGGAKEQPQSLLDLMGTSEEALSPPVEEWKVGDFVKGSKSSGGAGRIRRIFETQGRERAEILWPQGSVGNEGHVYKPCAQCLDLKDLKRPHAREIPDEAALASEEEPKKSDSGATKRREGPYTLETFQAYRDRLLAGEVSAKEHKEEFTRVLQAREELVASLMKGNNAKSLTRMAGRLGDFRANGNKKAENAASVHRSLCQSFVIAESVVWSPSEETWEDAMGRLVSEVTEEKLAAYVRVEVAAKEKREAKREERKALVEKALSRPETAEEFAIFCQKSGGEESLSVEQLEAYDRLRAEDSRQERREARRPSTVEQINQDVSVRVVTGVHTKKQIPLWIVQLTERVDREVFGELKRKAKALGGWYSSFVKSQAGFQFTSEAGATSFVALLDGDVDRSEALKELRRQRELSSGERLKELAATLRDKAREALSEERLTNTHRRAEMAAGIRGRARADIALAETTEAIGEALEAGAAVFLDGVRNRAQVALLLQVLRRAVYANAKRQQEGREHNSWNSWSEVDDLSRRAPTPEDVRCIEYPVPVIHASCLRRTVLEAGVKRGMKQAARHMAKRLEGADEYSLVDFSKEGDARGLLEFIEKAKAKDVDTEWIERGVGDFQRMRRAGIHTLPELRAAARELLPILAAPEQENPVEAAERELVGLKIPGFFPTPGPVVSKLLEEAQVAPGQRVLEPSCGKGDILDAVRRVHPDAELTGIELSAALHDVLAAKGHDVIHGDFLEHQAEYDRVVMNPPFEGGADIDHVRHAFALLAPGGRVVSVVSEGPFFREDKKAREFREWLGNLGATSEKLPADAFKGADAFRQTGVQTRVVTIDKRRDAPEDTTPVVRVDSAAHVARIDGVTLQYTDRPEGAEPLVIAQAVNELGDALGPSAGADSVKEAALAAYEAYQSKPYAKPRSP